MQTNKLDGKLDTDEVTIIGNDLRSNVKKPTFTFRVCYNCGKKFETEDKTACRCADCIKLYNQSKQKQIDIPFVDAWKPQKSEDISLIGYLFMGGIGLFLLISFILIIKGSLGILGS